MPCHGSGRISHIWRPDKGQCVEQFPIAGTSDRPDSPIVFWTQYAHHSTARVLCVQRGHEQLLVPRGAVPAQSTSDFQQCFGGQCHGHQLGDL